MFWTEINSFSFQTKVHFVSIDPIQHVSIDPMLRNTALQYSSRETIFWESAEQLFGENVHNSNWQNFETLCGNPILRHISGHFVNLSKAPARWSRLEPNARVNSPWIGYIFGVLAVWMDLTQLLDKPINGQVCLCTFCVYRRFFSF